MKTLLRLMLGLLLLGLVGAIHAEAPAALKKAPAWTLKDVDGHDVSFDQFKGKVVVIDFWATWCVPCRHEIPGYIALQDKYKKDGLVIIGISIDRAGPKIVKKFMESLHINYPVVMYDDDVVEKFGPLDEFPTTFLIDREGNIRDRKVGIVDPADYERRILSVLKN